MWEIDASGIWNCSKSGFPMEPSKGKTVPVKVSLHHDKSSCLENVCIRQSFNIHQALAFYDGLSNICS